MSRLLLAAVYFEIGIVLIVVPWLRYWDRNYFAELMPLLHMVMTNNYVRGAVSGIGVLNLIAGVSELASLFVGRTPDHTVRPASQPTEE